MSKEEEKTALERKLQIAVVGHSAEEITQALLNALHKNLGYAGYHHFFNVRPRTQQELLHGIP